MRQFLFVHCPACGATRAGFAASRAVMLLDHLAVDAVTLVGDIEDLTWDLVCDRYGK